jgi:two-component sensor histidine kinase
MAYDLPRPLAWPKRQVARQEALRARGSARRQMRLAAQFSRFAAGCHDVQPLLDEACCVAAAGLMSEFAKLLVYRHDERGFVLQAGTGWRDGLVGHARLDADTGTAAGFAWHTGQSVVSNDIVAEGRFRVPDILAEHGIGSSINVVVPGPGWDADDGGSGGGDEGDGGGGAGSAFGVLEVEGPGRGDFTADDVCFLQIVAYSLAGAVGRRAARALREEQGVRDALAHQESLREMHHRMRNDLQGICSSLDWEARRAGAVQREGFGRIIGRVLALAELYDQLLGASMADEVEFGAYLRALCGRIAEAGGLASRSIELRVEAQPLAMPRARALQLAVAVNELVSNAAEHAFAGRHGRISVGLLAADGAGGGSGGGAVLSVSDDGCGFAGPRAGGAGLGFVERLVGQAGATLEREDSGGTLWRITLPPE